MTPTLWSIYDYNYDILYRMADYGDLILGSASQLFGAHTPDTCFDILSIESTKWKVIHNTGVTVGGHGIRVTDIPIGVGV